MKPVIIEEDFGMYRQTVKHIPAYLMRIVTVCADRKAAAMQNKTELYSLHSSHFTPDHTTAIPAAERIMTLLLMSKLNSHRSLLFSDEP